MSLSRFFQMRLVVRAIGRQARLPRRGDEAPGSAEILSCERTRDDRHLGQFSEAPLEIGFQGSREWALRVLGRRFHLAEAGYDAAGEYIRS